MHEFHNPIKAVGSMFGGGGGTKIIRQITTPEQDTENEADAREEAARRARASAAARQGRRSTLLTQNPSGGLGGVNTARRSLLGG